MAVRLSALRAGHILPPGRFLVLISARGWVDLKAIVQLEGVGKLKKSTRRWTKSKYPVILSVIHHRQILQNLLLCVPYFTFGRCPDDISHRPGEATPQYQWELCGIKRNLHRCCLASYKSLQTDTHPTWLHEGAFAVDFKDKRCAPIEAFRFNSPGSR
jgi:hypothetical protein